ncbi:ZIP family metal transporter [Marinobacter sp. TBZ242]|uniref:ZIP family metal transporter n=1 Tax=Marinobacter azerbaijanicus TaxID=3050455 RepID=A0ABT7IHA8_9GAMM|nr:ZIP family metal transporter [Marinobacter sp. TBZ242]MDL0433547.1 ZIP family metal transporter [Marinobacter sp. TBZ242]
MVLEVTLTTVFIAALITALTTGLGALPLAISEKVDQKWLSIGAAIAAGLMLAASHSLIEEGLTKQEWLTLAGMVSGLVLVYLAYRWIEKQGAPDVSALQGADAKKALLIVGVMTAHSFAEGIGVGVSYGGSRDLGVFITAAIAVHNIPEGLAIALILVPRGMSVTKAAGWSIFSSLPQPLMAIPAYLFVSIFKPVLPFGLGLAAGAMIWMVFAELLPDANKRLEPASVGVVIVLAFLAMMAFQVAIR